MVGGPQDRSGHARHRGIGAAWIERRGIDRPAQQAMRALVDAEHFPPVALHRAHDDRADHGVEAGAIAAAGQYANPLCRTHHRLPTKLK